MSGQLAATLRLFYGRDMTVKADWEGRVGAAWAAEVARTDRAFAPLTAILVERILAKGAAHSILDIGCGAGELALKLSAAKPGARVFGVDVSPDLTAAAEARKPKGARLDFREGDAATWYDGWFIPDMLVSRHGVMFFDNPPKAFAHLADHAAEGARMVFSCFRSPAENPWASGISALLPDMPAGDPHAPGPFAFADPDRVRGILEAGGWGSVAFEAVDFAMTVGGGDDPVADAVSYFSRIGPAARALAEMDDAARSAFKDKVRVLSAEHLADGGVRFDAAAWIVTASKKD